MLLVGYLPIAWVIPGLLGISSITRSRENYKKRDDLILLEFSLYGYESCALLFLIFLIWHYVCA